jgi:hypothetical protein
VDVTGALARWMVNIRANGPEDDARSGKLLVSLWVAGLMARRPGGCGPRRHVPVRRIHENNSDGFVRRDPRRDRYAPPAR